MHYLWHPSYAHRCGRKKHECLQFLGGIVSTLCPCFTAHSAWRCRTSSDEKLAWDNVFFLFCMAASWRIFDESIRLTHGPKRRMRIPCINSAGRNTYSARFSHWPKNIVESRNCFNVINPIICFPLLFVLPLRRICFCLAIHPHGYPRHS